jgi:Na+-transporting methylmalonyl-CoA/oxaloacetate decarboxylase gamma subunit
MDNLGWGLQITALGMGLVFGLLALLWGLLTLVQHLDRERQAAPGSSADTSPAAGSGVLGAQGSAGAMVNGLDADLVAAITAATLAHRALRRREAAPVMRSYLPGSQASRWVGAGRTRQIQNWHRKGKA